MPYPYIYQQQNRPTTPSWSDYLAQYNQHAAHANESYRNSTGNHGAGRVYNQFDPGGGQGSAAAVAAFKYVGGDHSGVDSFGEGTNATLHGTNFQSDPNNTYAQQTYKDWLGDNKSGVALLPGANNWRAVQSYQNYNRSRDAQSNYQAYVRAMQENAVKEGRKDWASSIDPRIRVEMEKRYAQGGNGLTDAEVNQYAQQFQTSDTQNRLDNDVTQYFADPQREIKNNERIDAQKANSVAQLADQYGQLRVKEAQNSAAHGMLGSSVDISHRGQLDRSRDAAAVGVENQAQSDRAAFKQNDNQLRQQLTQLIHSGDPAQAQYAQQQLQALDQQTQGQLDLNGSDNQMYDINNFANSLYSQSLGGGLNAFAQNVNGYGPYLAQYQQGRG